METTVTSSNMSKMQNDQPPAASVYKEDTLYQPPAASVYKEDTLYQPPAASVQKKEGTSHQPPTMTVHTEADTSHSSSLQGILFLAFAPLARNTVLVCLFSAYKFIGS